MSTLTGDLNTARAELARLSGELSTLQGQFSQIPNGDLTAFLAEHARRGEEVARLTGELGTLTTRATTAEGEVTRLTAELATARAAGPAAPAEVQQQVEQKAADIVAGMGVPPAPAETKTAAVSSEPANSEAFYAEYDRLHAQSPIKAADYYRTWSKKF